MVESDARVHAPCLLWLKAGNSVEVSPMGLSDVLASGHDRVDLRVSEACNR